MRSCRVLLVVCRGALEPFTIYNVGWNIILEIEY